MNNQYLWIVAILALLIGLVVGFWWGGRPSYESGYEAALDSVGGVVEEGGQVEAAAEDVTGGALEEAAKAANPLLVKNPLKKVQTEIKNPFE